MGLYRDLEKFRSPPLCRHLHIFFIFFHISSYFLHTSRESLGSWKISNSPFQDSKETSTIIFIFDSWKVYRSLFCSLPWYNLQVPQIFHRMTTRTSRIFWHWCNLFSLIFHRGNRWFKRSIRTKPCGKIFGNDFLAAGRWWKLAHRTIWESTFQLKRCTFREISPQALYIRLLEIPPLWERIIVKFRIILYNFKK